MKRTAISLVMSLSVTLLFSQSVGTKTTAQSKKREIQILVGENISVGKEGIKSQIIEPHLAAHPKNPNHLIAVGTVHHTKDSNEASEDDHCVAFITFDGGKTWERKDLPTEVGLDSWVSITDNFSIITTLGNDKSVSDFNKSLYQLLVYFSSDGGKSWSKAQSLGNYHDGPRTTVSENGTVYLASHQSSDNVTSKIYVAKSRNSSFMEKTTAILPSYLNNAIDGITTYVDGTLAIAYQDFQRPISGPRKDEDGNWRGALKTRREWLIISEDKGQTFSEPRLISEKFFDRANDLASDKTNGEFKDRLYCIGSSLDYKSLLFTYSNDKGKTWTDEKQLEQSNLGGIRKEPQIAINKDGVLAISWLDSRDYGESDYTGLCYNTYMAFSIDGGKTFSEPTKISTEKSCVDPVVAGAFVARRWREGGDYFGMATTSDGKFHIVWPDARSGKFEVMTCSVEVKY